MDFDGVIKFLSNRGLDPNFDRQPAFKPLRFQVLQWVHYDKGDIPRPREWESDGRIYYERFFEEQRQYTICLDGVNENGNSVVLETTFNPWFYIQIPENEDADAFVHNKIWRTDRQMPDWLVRKKGLKGKHYSERNYARYNPDYDEKTQNEKLKFSYFTYKSAYVKHEVVRKRDLTKNYQGPNPTQDRFIKIYFKTLDAVRKCVNFLRRDFPAYTIFEANLEPIMRMAHLTDVQMAGWLEVDSRNLEYKDPRKETNCQIHAFVPDWRNLRGIEHLAIAPFIELSIDLECINPVRGQFPNPHVKSNVIAQCAFYISVTGQPEESRIKILLNVGPCDPLKDGSILIVCANERDLLRKFAQIVLALDPDTIHAYNAFGFDLEYLWVRAQTNGLLDLFKRLGKHKNVDSWLHKKEMKSGAYGANEWNIFTMPGRFVYDPMVHMRRAHQLPSYTLNYTSKEFLSSSLSGNPLQCYEGSNMITIAHKNHGFRVGDLINLSDVTTPDLTTRGDKKFYTCGGWSFDELHGKLHRIVNVVSEHMYIIEMDTPCSKTMEKCGGMNVKVFESKYEVSFNDMNEAFEKGNGKVMSEVGDYCVQDTILPQKIMDKLSVLPNLIELAKVRRIPIDYNITRGQAVGTFSLFSRAAYKRNVAVPAVARKTKDEDVAPNPNEKKEKYVGGAVLDPVVGYYGQDPIPVPDFASLYPSEMCDHKLGYLNLVTDERFRNLPGARYLEIPISENTTHVFETTEKSILGEILAYLLDERKAKKKQMNAAEDALTKSILNGAQLALKVCANSIYGFTGTNDDIALIPGGKPIAASTTWLGRNATFYTRDYYEDMSNFVEIKKCTTHFPLDYVYLCKKPDGYWCHFTAEQLMKYFKVPDHNTWENNQCSVGFDAIQVFGTKKEASVTGFSKVSDPNIFDGETLFKVHLSDGEQFDMTRYGPSKSTKEDKIVIYGDTDSVFTCYDCSHLTDRTCKIVYSQVVAAYIAGKVTHELRKRNPHTPYAEQRMELEYEKTYAFYILFSKKRYGGIMCELNPYKFKEDNKGTANKRRDFCSYVKEIYSKILEALFNFDKDDKQEMIADAMLVAKTAVEDLLNDRVPVEKLYISKSLNDEYKARTKNELKSKKTATFSSRNIFVGDLVDLKGKKNDDDRKDWKVVRKMESHEYNLRPKILLEKIEKETGNRLRLTVTYSRIAARAGKMMQFTTIVDPNTTEDELEPISQSHLRLARKMHLRDPGSAPRAGDRMYMVFKEVDDKNAKQYERAEDPEYFKKHNLKIDPMYYIQKQCKNAWSQILDTVEPGISKKLFDDAEARYTMTRSGQQSICDTEIRKRSAEIVLHSDRKILKKSNKARKKQIVTSGNLVTLFNSNSSNSLTASDMLASYVPEPQPKKKKKPTRKRKRKGKDNGGNRSILSMFKKN